MGGRPWFPFYPDAYERDAGHLSYVQDSAYRRMLDIYYKTGGPLPLDVEIIYRVCRAMRRDERIAIDYCLGGFFVKGPDGYHQPRADVELGKADDISAKRSQAASKRHSKQHAIAETIAQQLDTHLHSTATKEESSLRDDSALPPKRASRRSLPEDFPGQSDLGWATAHWLKRGRADLCEVIGEETEKFRDHHTGKNTTSANWPGSWRTWARNAMDFSRRSKNSNLTPFPTVTIHKVA